MGTKDLNVYKAAFELGEITWEAVQEWDWVAKKTVGIQMVRAADSVAANISEGFGRFHYKENRHFLYYARGSLFEFETWADKSLARALLTGEKHAEMMKRVRALTAMINRYTKSLGRKAASESE